MGMYLHIDTNPSYKAGEGKLYVYAIHVDDEGEMSRAVAYDDTFLNNDWTEGSRIELWVVATLRNILTSVESSMFTRLVDGEEKLTLKPVEHKEESATTS
jgi:hypothetical protein